MGHTLSCTAYFHNPVSESTRACDNMIIIQVNIYVNRPMSQVYFCTLGSWVSLRNFETIRGSLMKPKWQKLASLAKEICTL